ncbi:hypothetical protein CH379_007610 [Leptospira ellisii]|uniref:N-acyl amino acid synthase FeeM catalytic core domain-containing protein n=2 Tax=Leptospira ellisii TaxID=2023197 RepID=A0A2N0BA33_9LEPT|nr:hypothetical protein [Leptospira ellisii]MDV6235489.1 hypothetical protein [Leptospira ellisii]PJZ93399.1 hypothetical protein CH379_07985 [Leptospira ellisii]
MNSESGIVDNVKLVKQYAPDVERREHGRIDVRMGGDILLFATHPGWKEPKEFRVLDYSSLGLGIESLDKNLDLSNADIRENISVDVNFRLSPKDSNPYNFVCRIANISQKPDQPLRLGLHRILGSEDLFGDKLDSLMEISDQIPLFGLMDHPFLYDQTSLIKVKKISRKRFLIENYDQSLAIFPSMELVFSLNLFAGNEPIHARVEAVKPIPKGISFIANIDFLSDITEKAIVRYFLRLIDIGPFALRKIGFNTANIKNIMTYRFVKSQQEYLEVLKLRKLAYSAVKKLDKEADLSDVSHWYDPNSRIITAWHHDRLIGSANIFFANGEDVPFELQRHIKPEEFKKLPNPKDMIEVVGLCMHHDYRKSDILMGIFERIFHVLITTNKSYIIAASDPYLWKIYESIGFEKTGIKYTLFKTRELVLDVIMVHRRVGTYGGLKLDPLRWNELYRDMSTYLEGQGVLPKTMGYKILSPIYKTYIEYAKFLDNSQRMIKQTQKGIIRSSIVQKVLDYEIIKRFIDNYESQSDKKENTD